MGKLHAKGFTYFFSLLWGKLLFSCPFYRWENWGLGMLSDLLKEHMVKESGFESSFVCIRPEPSLLMSTLYCCLHTVTTLLHCYIVITVQLCSRAWLIMPSLPPCLLVSAFRWPFLRGHGSPFSILLWTLVLQWSPTFPHQPWQLPALALHQSALVYFLPLFTFPVFLTRFSATGGCVSYLFLQHLAHSRCLHVSAFQLYSFIPHTILNS